MEQKEVCPSDTPNSSNDALLVVHLGATSSSVNHSFMKKLKNILKFLAFREDNPKHFVVENLVPMHAVLTFIFLWIVPATIFRLTINMGLMPMLAAEMAMVFGALETMHIVCDR